MDLLADTNAVLWAITDDPRLGVAKATLGDMHNRVYVSAASAWEIAIKVSIGKLPVPNSLLEWLPRELDAFPFSPLPISMKHALAVESLPFHHKDPFDRMLVAQALAERLTIVSADPIFEVYGVPVVRC